MAREVKKMREEVMGALGLLLAEHGLGTWEEGRRLENTRGRLQRERVEAQRAHDVAVVAGKVSAEEARRAVKEREAPKEAEAAAVRQQAETVARRERELAVRKNLDAAAESVRTAGSEEEKMATCEALSKAHGEVKKLESAATAYPEVVTTGVWQVAGGVVTRKVEVVTRLNGPVGRTRTAELRGVVERVQALVKQKGHQSWVVAAVMWTAHAADEVLWRVTGVEKGTADSVVEDDLVGDVSAVIGTGIMRDHWVEHRRSRYVVVKGILESEWVKEGMSKLKGGDEMDVWGPRHPVVVNRVGKPVAVRVSVKLKVALGEVATKLVKDGVVFLGVRKEVVLAIGGGGARVPRLGGGGAPHVTGCFSCGERGHHQ